MLSLGVGVGVAIAVTICVVLLLLAVLLGLRRRYGVMSPGRPTDCPEEKQEMEWDNSSLTITVNHFDSESACDVEMEEMEIFTVQKSRSDDSNCVDSVEQHYGDVSGDETDKVVSQCGVEAKELEWDESVV